MKKLLTLIFVISAFYMKAQDTLVVKKDTIFCKITKITSMNIFYTENKIGKSIAIKDAVYYSKPAMVTTAEDLKPVKQEVMKDIKLSDEMAYIRMNLLKSHKQFKTGLIVYGASFFPMALGLLSDNPAGYMIVSGIGFMAASIIMIDSHKYIGRAGIGLGGKGVIIKYTF